MNLNKNLLYERLKSTTSSFHPVVDFNPETDILAKLDFTKQNKELAAIDVTNTELFSVYVNNILRKANAKFGIGGYNELRELYSRSDVFNTSTEEPRRLHLGIDIWGEERTPVNAPMEGIVHSFSFNDAFGDYGATLILSHNCDGVYFHTLYGHLSLASIQDKHEGQSIEKGEWIAAFGEPAENGQWPPHLHFQIIENMEGKKGDYPGVCKESEREKYLSNCPDPNVILNLLQYAKAQ